MFFISSMSEGITLHKMLIHQGQIDFFPKCPNQTRKVKGDLLRIPPLTLPPIFALVQLLLFRHEHVNFGQGGTKLTLGNQANMEVKVTIKI